MEPMKPMAPMKPMEPMKSMAPMEDWWPAELGQPDTAGSQNDTRYAFFARTHRLIIERAGAQILYDTGSHLITGVDQAQSQGQSLSFSTEKGVINVAQFKTL
jgi:hypothetical protein